MYLIAAAYDLSNTAVFTYNASFVAHRNAAVQSEIKRRELDAKETKRTINPTMMRANKKVQ